METINNIELKDAAIYPDDEILKATLGESYDSYRELLQLFDDNEMHYEWRYYQDGKAWLCKVQKKKRTIVWMSAWKGYMQAAVYFPGKFIDEIYALDISEEMKEKIRRTNNIGKSKPCIFEIRNNNVLEDLNKVMQFKIKTK